MSDFTSDQLHRYSRHIILKEVGVEGQLSLNQAWILGAIAGILGTIQATETLKFITGNGQLLTNTLMSFDALTMDFRKIPLSRQEDCPVCGLEPSITSPVDYKPAVCDPRSGKVEPGNAR